MTITITISITSTITVTIHYYCYYYCYYYYHYYIRIREACTDFNAMSLPTVFTTRLRGVVPGDHII